MQFLFFRYFSAHAFFCRTVSAIFPLHFPGQYHLKQISVQLDPELSALQFREAFGDGQPQSAALGITGGVSSDEPFRQFLSGYGQLLCRDIF